MSVVPDDLNSKDEAESMKEEFVAHYVMYTHDFFLEDSIESVYPFVDKILVARTKKPWFGPPVNLEETEEVLARIKKQYGDKIEIYEDAFPNEQTQRNFLIQTSQRMGYVGAFIIDADEVFVGNAFPTIYQCIQKHNPKALGIPYLTFIRDASFCVAPPYEVGLFYINLTANPEFTWARKCNLEASILRYEEPEILHLSYIRKNDGDILRKIRSFMHAGGDVNWDDWFQNTYLNFHPRLKNFHPTLPEVWRSLQEFDPSRFPSSLREKLEQNKKLFYHQHIKDKKSLKLHLGCGAQILEGYINIDLYNPKADLQTDVTNLGYFDDNSVEGILMNAVFEHLYFCEQGKALSEWYRLLKPNGFLIIQGIPDFDEVIKAYIQGAPGNGSPLFDLKEVQNYILGVYDWETRFGGIHKDIFTRDKVRKLLEEAGFNVTKIETVCGRNEPKPVRINVNATKPCGRKEEAVQRSYLEAQALIDVSRYDEAIAVLEKLLTIYPGHSLAHDDLGALYFQKGDNKKALEHFTQCLAIDRNNLNAMKNLADLSIESGYCEGGLHLYEAILEKRPTDVEALLGVGNFCQQTGRLEDSKIFYRKVLGVEPENIIARKGLEMLGGISASALAPEYTYDSKRALGELNLKPERKLVSIIILAYNQVEYTQKCLESIFTHTDHPFELILVDNGSTDGTAEYLSSLKDGRSKVGGWRLNVAKDGKVTNGKDESTTKESPYAIESDNSGCRHFRVIHNDENLGFSLGNNQGMAAARGDYFLLLNNDTVVTPGWLDRLIACAEQKEEIGIVGPVSNFAAGYQMVKEIDYDSESLEGLDHFAQNLSQNHAGAGHPALRIIGFCMLIKRAVVEKIGGFDVRYGVGHFEDDDFNLRSALAGFESWISKDCFVHHFGSRTFAQAQIDINKNMLRNWEIFKDKWGIPAHIEIGTRFVIVPVLEKKFSPEEHYCPLNLERNLISKGEGSFHSGDLEEARKIFEKILRNAPNNQEGLNNLGVVAFCQDKKDLAISCFTRALEIDADHFDAMFNLGRCLVSEGQYREAIPWLQRARKLKPNEVSLLNFLGNCLIQIEDFASAAEIYMQSYQLDKDQRYVREVLEELEKFRKTLLHGEKSIEEKKN